MKRKIYGLRQPRSSLGTTLTLVVLFIISCGKSSDTDVIPDEKDDTTVATGNFYKLIRVQNFQGDTTDTDNTAPKATLYYSLEDNTSRQAEYQKTSKWDLSFSGIYSSFIGANSGSNTNNFGYGSGSMGGILIVEKAFDEVNDVPADDQFITQSGIYGTDSSGAFGTGMGWYCYDFGGDIIGDKTAQKAHVAYALSETLTRANGGKIHPRTLIVRTASGNYAKVKMISVYKDAFTIDKWFKDTPHMFFTFEYVMIPKGKNKFAIK